MFEREYIFSFSTDKNIKLFVEEVTKLFKSFISSEANLYLHIRYSRTRRHKYLTIDIDSNVVLDKPAFLASVECIGSTSFHVENNLLSCVYPLADLTSLEYVELIKKTYNLKGNIIEVPAEDGCDELFICSTPLHYDIKFNTISICISLDKLDIPELLQKLKK